MMIKIYEYWKFYLLGFRVEFSKVLIWVRMEVLFFGVFYNIREMN